MPDTDSPMPDAEAVDTQPLPADPRARLVTKLARIMREVGRIPKNGWNDHFKYHFATEADVSAALQQRFAEANLMVVPEVDGRDLKREGKLTIVPMRFTIYDGDTGHGLPIDWAGNGEDNSDKALWKGITGGVKYFLMKLMLMPTGDDPEGTDADGRRTDKRQRGAKPAPAPARREPPRDNDTRRPSDQALISEAEADRLKALMRTHGVNKAAFVSGLRQHFGYTRSAEIQKRHYDAICRAITEGIGLSAVAEELKRQAS